MRNDFVISEYIFNIWICIQSNTRLSTLSWEKWIRLVLMFHPRYYCTINNSECKSYWALQSVLLEGCERTAHCCLAEGRARVPSGGATLQHLCWCCTKQPVLLLTCWNDGDAVSSVSPVNGDMVNTFRHLSSLKHHLSTLPVLARLTTRLHWCSLDSPRLAATCSRLQYAPSAPACIHCHTDASSMPRATGSRTDSSSSSSSGWWVLPAAGAPRSTGAQGSLESFLRAWALPSLLTSHVGIHHLYPPSSRFQDQDPVRMPASLPSTVEIYLAWRGSMPIGS